MWLQKLWIRAPYQKWPKKMPGALTLPLVLGAYNNRKIVTVLGCSHQRRPKHGAHRSFKFMAPTSYYASLSIQSHS